MKYTIEQISDGENEEQLITGGRLWENIYRLLRLF